MICPKCGKDTCVKVTRKNKTKVKEKKGIFHLIIWIITFPFYGLWRLLFGKKRENYASELYWNCRYCDHKFEDKGE